MKPFLIFKRVAYLEGRTVYIMPATCDVYHPRPLVFWMVASGMAFWPAVGIYKKGREDELSEDA